MNSEITAEALATTSNARAMRRPYRPTLRFFHANMKGTGCAVKFALHPAHDLTDGSIMVTIANQASIGNRQGPTPVFPRFDWENAIGIKLDFSDLCRMLQVFRGECESINNGHGLVHKSSKGMTKIVLNHLMQDVQGYSFEVYRNLSNGECQRAHILFSNWEALGLAESIAGSLSAVSFGIPMVEVRETSVPGDVRKERSNVSAA